MARKRKDGGRGKRRRSPDKTERDGRRKLKLPPEMAQAAEALPEFSTKDGLRRNVMRLLTLLQRDPALKELRFPRGDLFDALDRISKRDRAKADAMGEDDGAAYIVAKALPHLLTPGFVHKVVDALRSGAASLKDKRDARACMCGLFLIMLHESDVPPEANPLWEALFRLSFTEAVKAEEALEELMMEIDTADDMEEKLADPAFQRRLEAVVEADPEKIEEGARDIEQAAHEALDAMEAGDFGFYFRPDEFVHLPHAVTSAPVDISPSETDADSLSPEDQATLARAIREAMRRDLTPEVVGRITDWLSAERESANEAGDDERALRLYYWRMLVEDGPPHENPLLTALYWESLIHAADEAMHAPDSPLFRLLSEPLESLPYTLYADELMVEGKVERAERVFRAQAEFFAGDYHAQCNWAEALCELGRAEEATKALARALARARAERRRKKESVEAEVIARIETMLIEAQKMAEAGKRDSGSSG